METARKEAGGPQEPLRAFTHEDRETGQTEDPIRNHLQHVTVQFQKKKPWMIIIFVVVVLALVVVVIILSIRFATIHCGKPLPEWVWYNNSGYYYSHEILDWSSSKKFCENKGGMLAVFKDGDIKENVIRFKADGDNRWYGYYKMDGEWQWLDKSSLEDERLNNLSGKNCQTWNPSEQWEEDCSSKKKFICVSV